MRKKGGSQGDLSRSFFFFILSTKSPDLHRALLISFFRDDAKLQKIPGKFYLNSTISHHHLIMRKKGGAKVTFPPPKSFFFSKIKFNQTWVSLDEWREKVASSWQKNKNDLPTPPQSLKLNNYNKWCRNALLKKWKSRNFYHVASRQNETWARRSY